MHHIVGRPRHRLNLVDGVIASIKLNELIDWVLPRFDTLSFVAGFRSGLHILDIEAGEWRLIDNAEADRPGNHLNDAKADAQSHLLDARLRGGAMRRGAVRGGHRMYRPSRQPLRRLAASPLPGDLATKNGQNDTQFGFSGRFSRGRATMGFAVRKL